MLPEEAALLCEDSVESLFYKKWREQKLLVYNIARETQDKGRTKNTPRSEAGPFVLCIDTSGSMRGAAEKTAKSLVFALLREAFNTSRRCYLISFSTEISVLELSNLAESLGMLLDFLAMNFYGGSQIENALNEAVRVLQTEAYHNADVVLVSDFVLPAPDDVLASRILAAQENGTMFHGILTGIFADKLVNHSLLSLFDTVRSYDVF